jgi:ABC-type bacteriocin/lantibiotic exporter with double-glycine peptidase domain
MACWRKCASTCSASSKRWCRTTCWNAARAFLKDAPILVLDEATSRPDTLSENHVRGALTVLMADRTTIVIAHRLSTVRVADLLLVLNGGCVVERQMGAVQAREPRVAV